MRYGFTTGSCGAAAAKAAAYMLLTGREKKRITIETPKGIPYQAELLAIRREEGQVSCAVRKDGGDDPDITTGALVAARAAFLPDKEGERIVIEGGAGVGRVTRPGLDQPVGNAAINHVPREMIRREVQEVCRLTDYRGRLLVEISVPGGEVLAQKTFNPRLGIVGGISILGTTGIVEPMSRQALVETIRVELRQKYAEGFRKVAISPGNYGLEFMKKTYGYDLDRSVKCSNFVGETIDMAREIGFCGLLLTGHIGKLVKISGGIMNTHSGEGDCRMELLAAAAIREDASAELAKEILDCVSTEEAVPVLDRAGIRDRVMERLLKQILFYLARRGGDRLQMECILYTNGYGELAKSAGAVQMLETLKRAEKEREQ